MPRTPRLTIRPGGFPVLCPPRYSLCGGLLALRFPRQGRKERDRAVCLGFRPRWLPLLSADGFLYQLVLVALCGVLGVGQVEEEMVEFPHLVAGSGPLVQRVRV